MAKSQSHQSVSRVLFAARGRLPFVSGQNQRHMQRQRMVDIYGRRRSSSRSEQSDQKGLNINRRRVDGGGTGVGGRTTSISI